MILHVDMDAFFAAVEQRDDPRLRGRPVIVGADSARAVVAAASYEARRYGVRSAMPMAEARRRCPHAVVVPPSREKYARDSARIMDCLRRFSPLVEPVSIDEAYLDITGCQRLFGTVEQIARAVKAAVAAAVGLTCSVGGAPCKFLAKVASDMDKPDGLTLIHPDKVTEVIDALPVGKVPGVGPACRRQLEKMGIVTLGQVRAWPQQVLQRHLGAFGSRLALLAQGRDDSPVQPGRPVKSVSSEVTLEQDSCDAQLLCRHLLARSQSVARQLRRKGKLASVVVLKVKLADFTQHTRRKHLPRPTASGRQLYRHAVQLLERFGLNRPLRLVGVGAAGLVDAAVPQQACLFGESAGGQGRWEEVERAMDKVAERFGTDVVRPASLGASEKQRR